MKILDYITKYLAICAGWMLAILLVFGSCFQTVIYYQILTVALVVLCVYFALHSLGGAENE